MDTKILEDLGFKSSEIKVYLTLLKLGRVSGGQIIISSGLQSSVVYLTLNKLIDKGLVSFIKENKINYYTAANPKNILEIIDENKKKYLDLLPDLLALESPKIESDITTFRGIRGIKELLFQLLESEGKEHNTFGSPKESLMMGDHFWLNYHKRRNVKGIKAKLIFNESLKEWCKKNKHPNTEYKFTKKGFEPFNETIIRNDVVGIIFWIKNDPVGILIKNKFAARSYQDFFNNLWKEL
jgi:sugar-specific transcriptional regulator TrmB